LPELNIFISILHVSAWSKTKQFIVSLGIGLLVLMLGYAVDISLLQIKLQHGRAQKVKLKKFLQNKKQEAQKIKAPQKQDVILSQKSAGDFGVVDILSGLEKALFDSHVELQLFEPQPIKEEESFTIYSVKLEIYGQYKKLLGFINNVLKQPCFIVFEELILQKKSADDESNELNMQALLIIYQNKNSTETATKNNVISSTDRDVFIKTVSKTNLFLWSDKELHFIGLIKQNKNIYGFVSDPMGEIHRVVIGDKIGLKQSKIVTIDERGITTIDGKI